MPNSSSFAKLVLREACESGACLDFALTHRESEDSAHVGAIGLALEPLAWFVVLPPTHQLSPSSPPRCRANVAHIRQSRPDSGPEFQVTVLKPFQVFACSLERVFLWEATREHNTLSRVTSPESYTVLNLRTTPSQKCAAVPRRARIQGSYTLVSLNSRLESERKEEEAVYHQVYTVFSATRWSASACLCFSLALPNIAADCLV